MMRSDTGRLTELTAYDCWGLLESAELGRVAWPGPGGVALVPVNFTVVDGALWFRTEPSSALARQCAGQRVVVEADHVDPVTRSGWSVVVVGTAGLVAIEDVPDMLVEMRVWPAGRRSLFVRVEPTEVGGRRLWGSDPLD